MPTFCIHLKHKLVSADVDVKIIEMGGSEGGMAKEGKTGRQEGKKKGRREKGKEEGEGSDWGKGRN